MRVLMPCLLLPLMGAWTDALAWRRSGAAGAAVDVLARAHRLLAHARSRPRSATSGARVRPMKQRSCARAGRRLVLGLTRGVAADDRRADDDAARTGARPGNRSRCRSRRPPASRPEAARDAAPRTASPCSRTRRRRPAAPRGWCRRRDRPSTPEPDSSSTRSSVWISPAPSRPATGPSQLNIETEIPHLVTSWRRGGHAATEATPSMRRGSSVSRAMTRRWICDVPS